jgi:hypothetical protein
MTLSNRINPSLPRKKAPQIISARSGQSDFFDPLAGGWQLDKFSGHAY